jgi:D-alanine-D-alanine ligase
VAACLEYEAGGLIEQCIVGREFTVGILNDRALPVIELSTDREFYDYTAKYVGNHTQYRFDFDLPRAAHTEMQRLAEVAHQCLGASCFSRVDFMMDQRLQPYVLEVNTIPGMTDHSLLPKAAQQAGLSFGELCEAMVHYSVAAERAAA